ncbi:MAG: NAD+ synthase [Gammaproteobacteria bacterium]
MIKIILAQINLTVGDIDGNIDKIIDAIRNAEQQNADIILFPELCICSYPPEDLLFRPAFIANVEQALKRIISNTGDVYAIIGYPCQDNGQLYNACSLIHGRQLVKTYYKQELPNYGVFDEKRYFMPGKEMQSFEIKGLKAAMTICEDIWTTGPAEAAANAGVQILFNMNASPYHKHKLKQREQLVTQRAKDNSLYIAYTNLVGGQDELIFDGNSMLVDSDGEVVFHAPQFEEGLYTIELEVKDQQLLKQDTVRIEYASTEENVYQALVMGIRDYVSKNNFKGVVIGLSGGIDSALTTAIAVDALGADNVEVLIMPSRFTADMSNDDAIEQANLLGIKHEVISIEPIFEAMLKSLQPRFAGLAADITEENIQARCRGILLMAVSNKSGTLLLTTGNKSEMAVGYSTLYGDMCGGFAPLKDVWKTLAYRLANWRNQQGRVIPENVITRPPSAELREDQRDEDSLPPYEQLDPILERYIELDISPEKIVAEGFDREAVDKVVRLVDRNEYKRRQAAPGVRITNRAFGRDRRYPITSGYLET